MDFLRSARSAINALRDGSQDDFVGKVVTVKDTQLKIRKALAEGTTRVAWVCRWGDGQGRGPL